MGDLLGTVSVVCGDGEERLLAVYSHVCLGGGGRWYPGVVSETSDDIAEVIAYGINEGRVTADLVPDEDFAVTWYVTDAGVALLREHGVVD